MRIGPAGWPTRLLPPNVLYCILLALLSPTPISLFGRGRRLSAPAKAPADDAPRLVKPAPDDDVRPEPSRRVPEAVLLERCEEALREAGLREPAAAHVASALVAAQRDGKEAHGLGRLRAIISSLKDGTADGDAEPVVETLSPSLLRVSAAGGLAQPAIAVAAPSLAAAAREHGVACLCVVDARGIVGSLSQPLEALAADGVGAIGCCNSPAFTAPAGGTGRVFGTNPIGFAWPRTDAPPLVADFACSACARGSLQQAARRGEKLPPGYALDPRGEPTLDPTDALAGTQLAFGGHKGAALALLVELLSASLIGTQLAVEGGGASDADGMRRGITLLAFDPAAFVDRDDASASAERLFAAVREGGGRLPGESRLAARAAPHQAGGLALAETVREECGLDLGGAESSGRVGGGIRRVPRPAPALNFESTSSITTLLSLDLGSNAPTTGRCIGSRRCHAGPTRSRCCAPAATRGRWPRRRAWRCRRAGRRSCAPSGSRRARGGAPSSAGRAASSTSPTRPPDPSA